MKYQEAVRWLYGLEPRGIRLELDRMKRALEMLGNPERGMKFVHVAGTNGKGSVCAMVERGLRAAGYRTGLYTSPHLHRFVERVRVNGRPMSESKLASRASKIRKFLETPGAPALTFFEVATLLALQTFREAKCEVVVLEVGLGGRLDATNVVTPKVSVITRIAFDHMQYLGNTIESIAREKAGIVKRNVPLVLGVRDSKARRVIERIAKARGAKVIVPDFDERSRVALHGVHQRDNAAIALATLRVLRRRGFRISDDALRKATTQARWPARLELVQGSPTLLFDAAHNPDGCEALATFVHTLPQEPKVLLFAAMSDKDHLGMLRPLDGLFKHVVYAMPSTPRAAEPKALARVRKGKTINDSSKALSEAKRLAGKTGLVVIAGSIFLLAEARAKALGVRTEPPLAM